MDAEVSTHTFLTMIIEEYVCFMSCEPIFFCNYSYSYTEYIYIYSSTEHCTWAIISPPSSNLLSRAYHLHYCTGKQNDLLSNILRFALKICFWADFYVVELILVKIKWHIKWKYLIQKFYDICLSYYFKVNWRKRMNLFLAHLIPKIQKIYWRKCIVAQMNDKLAQT